MQPMIDRLELQLSGLQCPEAAFDDHQAFVSGGGIFRGKRVIIGFNDPLAISASRTLDSICVESYVATLCNLQVTLGTLGSEQVNRPLRGCLLILMPH